MVNVPEHFFPTLPLIIPASQGMPLWWYFSWWVFQIIIMGAIIWMVTRWAMKVDRLIVSKVDAKPTQSDSGSSVNS